MARFPIDSRQSRGQLPPTGYAGPPRAPQARPAL